MSTATPVTPVVSATPAAPAPVPAEQVNVNMTREQIAAAVPTPATAPATPAAPVPTPENPVITTELPGGKYKVQYLTGETFEGTASEILAKQGQAHVNTKNWARQEVEKAKQPAAAPTPPPASRFSSPEEEATAKYVTELQAKALGFDNAEQYQAALARVQQNTDAFAGQNLSIQFAAAAPEFNATAENNEKLLNTVESMGLNSLLLSNDPKQQLNALKLAHSYALQNKIYDPKPAAKTAPTPQIPPPPLPSTGPTDLSTIPDDLRVDVNMTREEIQRRIDLAKSRNYIF